MRCFVIMTFGQEGSPEHKRQLDIFENIIRKAVTRTGLINSADCFRVDLIDKSGSIVKDIILGLSESELVIADLTGKNPHVCYELGARHALKRPTILLAQSIEDIPFHLRTYRVLIYQQPFQDTDVETAFQDKLEEYIKAIVREPDLIDNPFHEYLLAAKPTGRHERLKAGVNIKRALEDFMRQLVSVLEKHNTEVDRISNNLYSLDFMKKFEELNQEKRLRRREINDHWSDCQRRVEDAYLEVGEPSIFNQELRDLFERTEKEKLQTERTLGASSPQDI